MRACILGDTGLLGQALVRRFSQEKSWTCSGVSLSAKPLEGPESDYEHKAFDIEKDVSGLIQWLEQTKPDLVVNCIAIVSHAICEENPARAVKIHVNFPMAISRWCAEHGAVFMQISTDQVFDGNSKKPYSENDPVCAVNEYGKSKLAGETGVLSCNPRALILRTNIVGFRNRPGSPTFAEWLLGALVNQEPITMFDDYFTSSMSVDLFSIFLLKAYQKKITGIYHLASKTGCSKYDFGRWLAQKTGLSFSQVKKGSLRQSTLLPKRPGYLILDVSKFEHATEVSLPGIEQTIDEIAAHFRAHFMPKEIRS